jgi:small subunit ribosomal protein S17
MAEKKTTAKKATADKKTASKPAAAKKTTTAAKAPAATTAKLGAKKTTAAKATAPKAAVLTRPAAPAAVKRARPLRRAPAASGSAQDAPLHSWRRSHRRTRIGLVTSSKQAHTVTVVVERMREHPLYKKVIRLRKKYAAHDAAGDVRAGDLVRIQESRPYSATKRWRVVEVLSRTGEAGAAAPRVADIAGQLEASEGVSELFAKPEREEEEEEAK